MSAASLAARLAALFAACALFGSSGAFAAPPRATTDTTPPERADCDDPRIDRVLEPARPIDARAVWLDRRVLRWPDRQAEGGSFLLLHAPDHARDAAVGAPAPRGALSLRPAPRGASAAAEAARPHVRGGVTLELPPLADARLQALHRGALLVAQVDAQGRIADLTATQAAGALDDLYAPADALDDYGAHVRRGHTQFRVWAPTARSLWLCLYASPVGTATRILPMQRDARSGSWWLRQRGDLSGVSYRYLVDVHVRGHGWVRQRVTDPYSTALTPDSLRSVVADLGSAALEPAGWNTIVSPHARAPVPTEMVIYELHVRDFSAQDATVPAEHRGKYLAFTHRESAGMRHLHALSQAGMTDLHLLPVFDIATLPERGCRTPAIPAAPADSEAQQAAARAEAAQDCFNWGYDPFHFNAPEGSYAADTQDPLARIVEFRRMVLALHEAGLRVGMDVVYNHTAASGQHARSVLDRIVPGYYQRLDARGEVERSTCCANTATEHRMMGKLLVDSLLVWARHYRVDSFRFDLMGHQPRALMERAQARLREALGRPIHFIGEGWNFGEVADNARFRQASQLELGGSGIGTFSDRARDALRGGGHDDSGAKLVARQGWLNGLHHDPNPAGAGATREQLLQAADLVRVGLAGSLRDVVFEAHDGRSRRLDEIPYGRQPAGYASAPSEVVNYADNHDNQTLFDINALRLPRQTTHEDRARVQLLGAAVVAFSQGVAYFHAGLETLRSKSLDRNSYDSGDWFNRLDWSFTDNGFGAGLPPREDNGTSWETMRPFLADARIKPRPQDIRWTRDAFLDLLRLRASSTLFRLRSADDVRRRLTFLDTGPSQAGTVMALHLDGVGLAGAGFREVVVLINADRAVREVDAARWRGHAFTLHPVHRAPQAADPRAREARWDPAAARFNVPPRTAVVFVRE